MPQARLGDAAWLNEGPVARLLALLDRDGEEARVVGGAVRNALLGLPVAEIDVATTALPAEVMRRVTAAGCKAIPTGIEHGTVTVIIEHQPVEVTTLRQDVETFGRKARVAFGRDWRADAERRDFTINALSASADGMVYDYVGGLADIAARRVRFIGDAQKRIEEDYLRILRFFRFHAYFGEGAPDAAGLLACIRARAGLERLSRERVRMEVLKLLLAPHAAPTLAVMTEAGLLGGVLGGVHCSQASRTWRRSRRRAAWRPTQCAASAGLRCWSRRMRKGSRSCASPTQRRSGSSPRAWWRVAPAARSTARALFYRLGPQSFADRVLVAWARSPAGTADAAWRELASLPQRWTAPVFPLKAADFIRRGIGQGPALGAAMRAAESAWIAADFPVERAVLDAIADEAAQAGRAH
jgi:poly(A) polymerase